MTIRREPGLSEGPSSSGGSKPGLNTHKAHDLVTTPIGNGGIIGSFVPNDGYRLGLGVITFIPQGLSRNDDEAEDEGEGADEEADDYGGGSAGGSGRARVEEFGRG